MSEGEFKKRISLVDGETKRWGSEYRTFIAKDTVDLIADEACKEFDELHQRIEKQAANIENLANDRTSTNYAQNRDWRLGTCNGLRVANRELQKLVLKYFGSKREA